MAEEKTARAMTIQRGGEEFTLEKSADLFVVKRTSEKASGPLAAVANRPEAFAGLQLHVAPSPKGLELYRVNAASLDEAMDELRKNSPDVAWCAHVYHMPHDPEGSMIPTDRIHVELQPGANAETVNRLLDEHGLELIPDPDGDPNVCVVRLTSVSRENPIKIANALRNSDAVKLAEPNFTVQGLLHVYRPTDHLFSLQWHLENQGGTGLTAGADVSAPQAWDISRGSRNINVAVIDDGFDLQHPDFGSPGKVVAPQDFGQQDTDPSPGSASDNHGTACAGVAVADENGNGVVGLAPECSLMPIRWSAFLSDDDILDQFDHARLNGADVISCSWGADANVFALSTSMKQSIHRAATEGRHGKGCVVVFAAGNANHDINNPSGGSLDGFAIHPDVIAVAASNSRDKRSHYSNFGDDIWVCAPSSGAGGLGIVTTDRRGTAGYQTGDYTTTERFGGTSSATPLVAGLCGLILSVNPDLTAAEVKEVLKVTADKIDPQSGNYDTRGHSRLYGWGRVNAFAALQEARRRRAGGPAERIVRFESRPGLAIPDRHPVGVSDSIQVGDSSTVQSVQVDVNITHAYRGDLQVVLTGPDGTSVPLFGRTGPTGDSQDNLIAQFTADNVPGLTQLDGKNASGNWSLQVADLATADVGVLNSWVLTLSLASAQTAWEVTPGTRIPDNDATGIASDINVNRGGRLRDMSVSVDISHTYRGDLKVTLEAPNGMTATLKNVNNRDGADNLRQTYRPSDSEALRTLVTNGTDIRGRWRLRVSDNLSADEGKLNAWGLQLS